MDGMELLASMLTTQGDHKVRLLPGIWDLVNKVDVSGFPTS